MSVSCNVAIMKISLLATSAKGNWTLSSWYKTTVNWFKCAVFLVWQISFLQLFDLHIKKLNRPSHKVAVCSRFCLLILFFLFFISLFSFYLFLPLYSSFFSFFSSFFILSKIRATFLLTQSVIIMRRSTCKTSWGGFL